MGDSFVDGLGNLCQPIGKSVSTARHKSVELPIFIVLSPQFDAEGGAFAQFGVLDVDAPLVVALDDALGE